MMILLQLMRAFVIMYGLALLGRLTYDFAANTQLSWGMAGFYAFHLAAFVVIWIIVTIGRSMYESSTKEKTEGGKVPPVTH